MILFLINVMSIGRRSSEAIQKANGTGFASRANWANQNYIGMQSFKLWLSFKYMCTLEYHKVQMLAAKHNCIRS